MFLVSTKTVQLFGLVKGEEKVKKKVLKVDLFCKELVKSKHVLHTGCYFSEDLIYFTRNFTFTMLTTDTLRTLHTKRYNVEFLNNHDVIFWVKW